MTAPVKRGLSCLMPAAAPLYLENYEVVNKVDASFEWESPDPCFPCLWDISSGLFLFPVTY